MGMMSKYVARRHIFSEERRKVPPATFSLAKHACMLAINDGKKANRVGYVNEIVSGVRMVCLVSCFMRRHHTD